ncbi:hypothetical protein [Nonomuraea sp. GTA35]|uniref:hypothetical protein n=1 Tax=Nonomuraea sp. GTA35 TaxID=1676746 RepID=UPI0035BF895A
MGGKPFMTDAAHLPALPSPAPSRSGLRVRLSGSESFSHGEPVTVEIKLSLDGSRPAAEAIDDLTPGGSHLTVLITDPAGEIRPFQPIARDCGRHRRLTLDAGTPALYAGAYLGYGAGGFTFPEPGTYRLQARYRAPDGSTVVSPEPSSPSTRPPTTPTEPSATCCWAPSKASCWPCAARTPPSSPTATPPSTGSSPTTATTTWPCTRGWPRAPTPAATSSPSPTEASKSAPPTPTPASNARAQLHDHA